MKKNLFFFFVLAGIMISNAQETAKSVMIQKKEAMDTLNLVDRFDVSLASSQEALDKSRQASKKRQEHLLKQIDFADLKENQKQKLRYDVMHRPFSKRLRKFVQTLKVAQTTPSTELVTIDNKP